MTTICTSFHLGNFRLGSRAECNSFTFQLSPETASDSSARPPQARPSWGAHGRRGPETQPDASAEGGTFLYKTKKAVIGQTQKCRHGKTES